MLKMIDYTYTADPQYQPPVQGFVHPEDGHEFFYYDPEQPLIDAVNLAIALKRPLLLEGDPGSGKTRLAGSIAYEFTQRYLSNQEPKGKKFWPYFVWNIKSSTRAQDGLYNFDAIGRLRDAQLLGVGSLDPQELSTLKNKVNNKRSYRKFGPLGHAFQPEDVEEKDKWWHSKYRPIVLIDEIDKADPDFCNDLLLEMEEQRFEIPETVEKIKPPQLKPIIIITSNRERPLPDAFLRRCIYFFVEPLNEERLQGIVDRRFSEQDRENKSNEIAIAIKKYLDIRDQLEGQPSSRAPSTSELLDFIQIILKQKVSKDKLNKLAENLPLLGTLIKSKEDQKLMIDYLNQSTDQVDEEI
jgi:MoxR-like ATPase